jgi:hypothetical protein
VFIRDNSAWLNIEAACIVLGVSKSSYYDWLGNYEIRQAKLAKEQELAEKVVAEFNRSRQTYGATWSMLYNS